MRGSEAWTIIESPAMQLDAFDTWLLREVPWSYIPEKKEQNRLSFL